MNNFSFVDVRSSSGKSRVVSGVQTILKDIILADDSQTQGSNTKCSLSAWGTACSLFDNVLPGTAVTLLGCSASQDERGELRINMSARNGKLLLGGSRADELTAWSCDAQDCELVTSSWQSPNTRTPITVDGPAIFTCAAAMAQLQGEHADPSLHEAVFQVNRAVICASAIGTQIHTQNGERLYVQAFVHDWTGRVPVSVVESAVPSIFGLNTKGRS